jgi:hypothetical protein
MLMEEDVAMLKPEKKHKTFFLVYLKLQSLCMKVMCSESKIGFSLRSCFNFSSGKMGEKFFVKREN